MALPELTKVEKEALRQRVLAGMPTKEELAKDPELAGIDAALRRAAAAFLAAACSASRARRRSLASGSCCRHGIIRS